MLNMKRTKDMETMGMERTKDTTQAYDIKGDAKRVFDCVRDGGVAIARYDVGYAILCATDDALRRVYTAKQRSYEKASAIVACPEMAEAVHVLPPEQKQIIQSITVDHKLPLSVVAPFRDENPFMRKLTPFLFSIGTREGTVSCLHNAGEMRDEIGRHCWQQKVPFLASSANRSMQGAKYDVKNIEPEVLAIADIVIDHGPCKYNKFKNVSASQIDFRTMTLLRKGHCFDEIEVILKNEFDIVLKPKPHS